jgi:hypothetical protein
LPKSCMPMTAKMKMMMQRTKVRLDSAPTVFIMIVRMSFRDFQDLASLNTLQEEVIYCTLIIAYYYYNLLKTIKNFVL